MVEDHAHPAVECSIMTPGILPENLNLPAIRPQDAEQKPDERGLPGTVKPDKTVRLALLNRKAATIQDGVLSKGFHEIICRYNRGHGLKISFGRDLFQKRLDSISGIF
jgi:hypothetical protein